MAYELDDFSGRDISVAMTADTERRIREHFDRGNWQEDLCFAYWRPSTGQERFTAILTEAILPVDGDRLLHGNAAFLPQYLQRVLAGVPEGCGVAFLHSHLGPGWQAMSGDDVRAEGERLAGQVSGRTGLPLVGLTSGTDNSWSARIWVRESPRTFRRLWARTVRVAGRRLTLSFHPDDPPPGVTASQISTLSVWGSESQGALARTRVGVVGLGSVGSLVAEALSRLGVQRLTYIDFDRIEQRNLDRTLGASAADVLAELSKVQVAGRATGMSHTGIALDLRLVNDSLLSAGGLAAALDCDVLVSCVDRPWPRFVLNAMAYSHLIPVIDGGIAAQVKPDGSPLHVDWRVHPVGPERACMVCLGALRRSDVSLEMDGKLDDPDYIHGLSDADRIQFERRNVFPFSMSVAAHEVLQVVGVVTGQVRIGGAGPQMYHCYPGVMEILDKSSCDAECEFASLTAQAADLTVSLPHALKGALGNRSDS